LPPSNLQTTPASFRLHILLPRQTSRATNRLDLSCFPIRMTDFRYTISTPRGTKTLSLRWEKCLERGGRFE
jgi:hypothetical protein